MIGNNLMANLRMNRDLALAASAALTWLLMMPPPKMPPTRDTHGNFEVNMTVPVTRWLVYGTYRNEAACRGDLKAKPSYFMCVDQSSLPSRSSAATAHTPAAPAPKTR